MKFFGKLLDDNNKNTSKIDFDMSILTNRRIDALLIKLEDFKIQAMMSPNLPALRGYYAIIHSIYSYLQSVGKWQKILISDEENLSIVNDLQKAWRGLQALFINSESGGGLDIIAYTKILNTLINIDETLKYAWQHLFNYFFRISDNKNNLLDEALSSMQDELLSEDEEDIKYIEEMSKKEEQEQKKESEKEQNLTKKEKEGE